MALRSSSSFDDLAPQELSARMLAPSSHSASTQSPSSNGPAVALLLADLKVLTAYTAAANWQEPATMKKAFDSISWHDPHVLQAVPHFLHANTTARQRIDYAFNALHPTPIDPTDSKLSLITFWIKARLYAYDQVAPFNFNPLSRYSKK